MKAIFSVLCICLGLLFSTAAFSQSRGCSQFPNCTQGPLGRCVCVKPTSEVPPGELAPAAVTPVPAGILAPTDVSVYKCVMDKNTQRVVCEKIAGETTDPLPVAQLEYFSAQLDNPANALLPDPSQTEHAPGGNCRKVGGGTTAGGNHYVIIVCGY